VGQGGVKENTMANNVNDLFCDLLYRLREAPTQHSRNGMVRTLEDPILFQMRRPYERVLFCPQRRANPYFHVMETVWMFAGQNEVDWLLPFNRRMNEYANEGIINGAYGHRWLYYFHRNQIGSVVRELQRDPGSRQAVIGMYDPNIDFHDHWRDRPCNTHIYFRKRGHHLDMTVCNRSNDVVWGACGANAVHLTYLHELVAAGLKCFIGRYNVMSNNLHIYQHHWDLLRNPQSHDKYRERDLFTVPLIGDKDNVMEFLNECEMFIKYDQEITYSNRWLETVAKPMYGHYMSRLNGDKYSYDIEETEDDAWALAEHLWREWHD
jgi:thymidylate synthase